MQNIPYLNLMFFKSGFLPEAIMRVTQEFVTPRYRATSVPEYPSSLTLIHDVACLASTTTFLRPPERSSFMGIPYASDTLFPSVRMSIRLPDTTSPDD